VRIWDIETGVCIRTLKGHICWIVALAVLNDGMLASGSTDNTVRIWSYHSGECLWTLHAESGKVIRTLAALKDGTLAAGSDDGSIRIWNVIDGECLRTLFADTNYMRDLVVLNDGKLAAASGKFGNMMVHVWE
jgi:WD40 repeat protein